ncbi:type VI secretion system-associated protein TagO [Pontibaca salina]|uniref:Type VI secretion system protein VasI n=1 Tax=Pontibaca salina TaxID=2795731 RepID=A0A934LZ68_9RHOB|nr:type VI secretion system-associated protein TagO [Pontibaca salina]MBI6628348.1 hypothetical protein [Pontibaca salina]
MGEKFRLLRINLMRGLMATTILMISMEAAAAQEECAKIADPDDRLNCFDHSYKVTEIVETASDWDVRIDKSKLDDSTTVVMAVDSDNSITQQLGGSSAGNLIIRCQENTTSIYLTWGGHFMADIQGKGRVDYRIDDRKAARSSMRASTDNKALGLWNGASSIPFIKAMFGGVSLYVRATPFSESPVEMTFNISGLEEEIAPLREACNW